MIVGVFDMLFINVENYCTIVCLIALLKLHIIIECCYVCAKLVFYYPICFASYLLCFKHRLLFCMLYALLKIRIAIVF